MTTDTEARPRLCRDLYESNVNGLLGELRSKLGKVQSVRASAKPGGDYEHTCAAQVRTIYAALDAAEKQFRLELERDQQKDRRTWPMKRSFTKRL